MLQSFISDGHKKRINFIISPTSQDSYVTYFEVVKGHRVTSDDKAAILHYTRVINESSKIILIQPITSTSFKLRTSIEKDYCPLSVLRNIEDQNTNNEMEK